MAILTEKTKLKNQRDNWILKRFKCLMSKDGSQRQAVYELIAKEAIGNYKLSVSTVQKVVKRSEL